MLGAWTGRHTFYSPSHWRDTASFLRWEHVYVKRKWLCVESYSVPFYLLRSCLLLVSAGDARELGFTALTLCFLSIIFRVRMPT